MLHRRLLRDDHRGVGQALDDFHEVTPRFFVLSSNITSSTYLHRRLANVIQYPMENYFIPYTSNNSISIFSPLTVDLPYNVRIITLKQRDNFVCFILSDL